MLEVPYEAIELKRNSYKICYFDNHAKECASKVLCICSDYSKPLNKRLI